MRRLITSDSGAKSGAKSHSVRRMVTAQVLDEKRKKLLAVTSAVHGMRNSAYMNVEAVAAHCAPSLARAESGAGAAGGEAAGGGAASSQVVKSELERSVAEAAAAAAAASAHGNNFGFRKRTIKDGEPHHRVSILSFKLQDGTDLKLPVASDVDEVRFDGPRKLIVVLRKGRTLLEIPNWAGSESIKGMEVMRLGVVDDDLDGVLKEIDLVQGVWKQKFKELCGKPRKGEPRFRVVPVTEHEVFYEFKELCGEPREDEPRFRVVPVTKHEVSHTALTNDAVNNWERFFQNRRILSDRRGLAMIQGRDKMCMNPQIVRSWLCTLCEKKVEAKDKMYMPSQIVLRWASMKRKLQRYARVLVKLAHTRDGLASGRMEWAKGCTAACKVAFDKFWDVYDKAHSTPNQRRWRELSAKKAQQRVMGVWLERRLADLKAGRERMPALKRARTDAARRLQAAARTHLWQEALYRESTVWVSATVLQAYVRKTLSRQWVVRTAVDVRTQRRAVTRLQASVRQMMIRTVAIEKYKETRQRIWTERTCARRVARLAHLLVQKQRQWEDNRARLMAEQCVLEEELERAQADHRKAVARVKRQRRKDRRRQPCAAAGAGGAASVEDGETDVYEPDVHEPDDDLDSECRLCAEPATVESQCCARLVLCRACKGEWEAHWAARGLERGYVQCLALPCQAFGMLDEMCDGWVVL